ncbi:hypothetical protein pb186bvf_007613 [Paramecium bursaria]
MGNNQANKDFGGIVIRTDNPFYFSGQTVTGNIYLYIQQDGFPGSRVYLRVSGKEYCRWEEHRTVTENVNGESRSRTEVDVYTGKNSFYCHKIIIYQFNTPTLPRGQYTFPFQFQMQAHLPGSFYEQGSQYKAVIKYRVKAEIDSFDKKYKSIKDSQELILREPLKTNIEALRGQMEVKAKVCCCVDKGTSHIVAVFDKNNYLPGDPAYLWIDIDNSNCQLNITRVEATLQNYLTLRSNNNREKVISRVVNRSQIEGLVAGEKALDNNRKQMQVQLVDLNSQGGAIKPSTNGQLVRSVYEMSAKAVLEGCTCCSPHPEVRVPITVVAPVPLIYNQPPPQPSNWNPQVFQPQLVSFNQQDLYVKSQNQGMNQQMAQPYM